MVNAASLLQAYRRRFDGAEPLLLARAPGRVNLLGEHVDYNDGRVLPIAIEPAILIAAGPAEDGRIRVHATTFDETIEVDLHDPRVHGVGRWGLYVIGVVKELAAAGVSLVGAQLVIGGDLPMGAGLASSAALEVAVALSLSGLAGATLAPDELARVCHRAERRHAGVPCGIMDPYVCVMATAQNVLHLDCRDERVEHIPWPEGDADILVLDSRCSHRLSDGIYAERVRQCAAAVEQIRRSDPTVRSLRDVTPRMLAEHEPSLDAVVHRRARHVVSEIRRTAEAVEALKCGDMATFGRAMNDSHESLRRDYEVSSPELDDLAAVARGVPGVFGARMTGAGFGGCVVALARRGAAEGVESAVRNRYDTHYGVTARLTVTRPCQGASLVPVAHA